MERAIPDTWLPADHTCAACGFRYLVSIPDAVHVTAAAASGIGNAIAGADDALLRTRPSPWTWSVIEYTCHLRDSLLVAALRLYLARVVERPVLEPMLNDVRARLFRYNEADLRPVLAEIGTAAAGLSDAVGEFAADEWQRTVVRVDAERTAGWLVRNAAHETTHHIADVRHVRAAAERATGR